MLRFSHKIIRVKWDRSNEGLILAANLKNVFVVIGVHVIEIIDGFKIESLESSDSLEQNRDCNGWLEIWCWCGIHSGRLLTQV